MKNIMTLINTIVTAKPNTNFLNVACILPFCTPLNTKMDINMMSNIIRVVIISPQFPMA